MKDMKNWMLAAILVFCGASVVMSSCGDDDGDSKKNDEPTANTYEVTISAVLPQCAADLYTLIVDYTGADGVANSITMKDGDKSDEMSNDLKAAYEKEKKSLGEDTQRAAVLDKNIVKNITLVVPAGKGFSYKATMKARTDYAKPEESGFYFIKPFVYVTCKRISGNSEDYSFRPNDLNLSVKGPFDSSQVAEFIEIYDGTVVAKDAKYMQ